MFSKLRLKLILKIYEKFMNLSDLITASGRCLLFTREIYGLL